ncbi:UNVERIFIED_CONTAM: LysM domain-containing protein [Acetivibrio alkalicellulosi]
MSLELIKESTRVNYVIGEESSQTIVEHDIIVPDINPDVLRILLLDGEVVVDENSKVSRNKANVKGTVRYKILYVSDDGNQQIKSINATSDFAHSFELSNNNSESKMRIKSDVEHIDYEILNGRKINVKTIVKFNAKLINESDQEVVRELRGSDDLQILKESLDIYCYLGENFSDYSLKESLEIPVGKPSIKEILRTDVKIVGKDYKISDDKIIAKGDINILTLYIGDTEDRNIEFMEHEVPFTQFIELQGVDENSQCDIDYRIDSYSFEPEEDSDGEFRILKSDIKVLLRAEANSKKNLEIISDAYSMKSKIDFETQLFKTSRIVCQDTSQIILKDVVKINGDSPDLSEVFNVLSKPNLFESSIMDGEITLAGTVNNSILYVANNAEQPVYCHYNEMPFKHNIKLDDLKTNMNCEIDLEIDHCNYSMVSENEVELRVVINVYTKAIDQTEHRLITKAVESEQQEIDYKKIPSMIIYFSKYEDCLWDIAKKYQTTVDDIKKVNKLDNEELLLGKQIIIPRKTVAPN